MVVGAHSHVYKASLMWHPVCNNNKANTQMNKRFKSYEKLLQDAGISQEAMAHHLASKGIGTVEQWRHAIATGRNDHFTDADKERGKAFFKNNPQLVQQIRQVVGE